MKNNIIRRRSLLLGLFLLVCTMSGAANAALTAFNPGWPRFIIQNMAIQNSGIAGAGALAAANGISLNGTGSSLFIANSTGKIQWQDQSGAARIKVLGPSATVWAEIDTATNTVLQGRIDIFGDVLGFNGLQFGADLTSSLLWQPDKLGFGQINHMGNVCNLSFCSYVEELLMFKNLNLTGNFSVAFTQNGKVISTVPVPAAAWLFISGVVGLFGFSRKRIE